MTKGTAKDKPEMLQKIVIYYHKLLKEGSDPSETNSNFWDEFFLLWANVERIEEELKLLNSDLIASRANLVGKVANTAVAYVKEEQSGLRVVNALRTLTGLTRGLTAAGVSRPGPLLFAGETKCRLQTEILIDRLKQFLSSDLFGRSLKSASLSLLLTFVTCCENIDKNDFVDQLCSSNCSIFDGLIQLLKSGNSRQLYGHAALFLLVQLASYRKFSSAANPYVVRLSILDDELVLTGYSEVIARQLWRYVERFKRKLETAQPKGMLAGVTSLVGGMFVADHSQLDSIRWAGPFFTLAIWTDEVLLLAMYEAVHLNRNFIASLTTTPVSEVLNGESSTAPNLLTAFLSYASVVLQDVKSERARRAASLCAIILNCIVEDQFANALMHDLNLACQVELYRAPMRHRRGCFDKEKEQQLRSLAASLIDLCVEFVLSHLMKTFPHQLYRWILDVIHKLLCYQKRYQVRLSIPWRELWNALIALLKFLTANDTTLAENFDVFAMCQQVAVILNLFITFGDTFLPSPTTYDQLYYELIRQADVFEALHSIAILAVVHGSGATISVRKPAAVKLLNHLVNIRVIISHFKAKVETLGSDNRSEEQVLELVKLNYDTLTLKLYENLDYVERYDETSYATLFEKLCSEMVKENWLQRYEMEKLDQRAVIAELSSIS